MSKLFSASARIWLIAAALAVAAFFVLILWATAPPAEGYIADNVFVGNINLGGLTILDAEKILQNRLNEIEMGWTLNYQDRNVVVKPVIPLVYDLGPPQQDLAVIDTSATVQRAYAVSRAWRLTWRHPKIVVPAFVTVREKDFFDTLLANFPDLEKPPTEPSFIIDKETREVRVVPESVGQHINKTAALRSLEESLKRLEAPIVTLSVTVEKPTATLAEAQALTPKVQAVLDKLPLELKYEDQSWSLKSSEVAPYLVAVKKEGSTILNLRDGFRSAVLESISKEISRPVSAARFKMESGKVTLWQPPLDGRMLDMEATLASIQGYVNSQGQTSAELIVKIEPAPSIDGQGRNLGIREIIGVGKSNFKGSPKNRRHNIKVGADTLNGILIAPNEEFSLVKALGEIDATAGYLQELVIKGNRTIPEFGGGLCQIGTTIFRAALASGLPIVERQNHSYRVVYYEPAGTDATIYNPKPDFRFLNDTGQSILIQTKIKGDDLIFEFWGTKDGRQITQTTPRIFNIVKPPAKKIIETTELPAGQEKCTEKAHNGADTEFTYTVVYADGVKKEKVFKSHYRPWQEVCLLGVKELSAPSVEVTPPLEPNGVSGADSPAVVTTP